MFLFFTQIDQTTILYIYIVRHCDWYKCSVTLGFIKLILKFIYILRIEDNGTVRVCRLNLDLKL